MIGNFPQVHTSFILLAANDLPTNTPQNQNFPASSILKIPFPCSCRNGTGISNRRPNYIVIPNDTLFHIAAEVFSRVVTFTQIQLVNNIPNPDMISVGQRFWIPLPCSCDDVEGQAVVHYGHFVQAGSTVSGIAERFNTTESTLHWVMWYMVVPKLGGRRRWIGKGGDE
ncbi:Peptidoglycan-binding lysin domain-containing protein [Cynara cardunculus var. scolymus]|uniref:Peptidoglycan-binding lysin domain-containing protein n=1 Tax=Cynara cardunculus var. scolymus TaxID=59895 RepID=A0A118K3S6_CYNCS|nr:Peptidoglycan-binding lysin domain-containing protein [Cynara cardunculus var. scolymus]